MNLILASASPRRNLILTRLGIPFQRITAVFSEKNNTSPGREPYMVAMENAQNKALAVKNKTTGETPALIIGADTIVVIDGSILPKPANRDEAVAMLQRLSGRTHQVITAIAVAPYPTGEMLSDIETTMVKFRRLTKDEILGYADSGEPLDKAGAYGIQGLGVFLVDGITGDYPNVVGLPVRKLYEMLRKFNVDIFRLSLRQKAGTEVNVI